MSMGDGGRPVINSSLLATHMPHRADMHAATRHSAEVVCFAQEHHLPQLPEQRVKRGIGDHLEIIRTARPSSTPMARLSQAQLQL